MWYNTVPTISAASWLAQVVRLFDNTLRAILGQPVLVVFVGLEVFILAFWVFFQLRKGVK